jgi:preprotein translocase subunit SecA
VVQNGEVIIVDEFTGRLMPGGAGPTACTRRSRPRKASRSSAENQTLASITFQNYFRMYGKLAGMTGTADTEAYEFQEIYGLETVVVIDAPPDGPPGSPGPGLPHRRAKSTTRSSTTSATATRGQPVLVGTTSIESSELLSDLLTRAKLPHQVLNAKQHAREAEIVAQAGRPKMLTIATNMAGRGTDIVLGGNVEQADRPADGRRRCPTAEREARAEKFRTEWQSLHDR